MKRYLALLCFCLAACGALYLCAPAKQQLAAPRPAAIDEADLAAHLGAR